VTIFEPATGTLTGVLTGTASGPAPDPMTGTDLPDGACLPVSAGEPPDRHADRLLDILEALSRHAPATLAVLVDRTGLPRGAVWRALDGLRAKGWVRMRHGDRAYELRAPVSALFAQARTTRPEVESVMPLFERLAEIPHVHVDLGMFTAPGAFHIVETTRKDGYDRRALSLTDDDIAIVSQVYLEPTVTVRHLKAFMERASSEERQVIASGEHARTLRRLRDTGQMSHDDGAVVALASRAFPGLGLRVELWRVSKARIRDLHDRLALLHNVRSPA
jgi:DNA-binding Lrp family transcriptional regulator